MADEIDRRLEPAGGGVDAALCDHRQGPGKTEGKAVGMTTYMDIEPPHKRLEIGSTWYRKSVQRSGLNTECKLLLLTHAFEVLDCIAVEFRTHFMNRPEPQRHRTARCQTRRHLALAPGDEKRHAA